MPDFRIKSFELPGTCGIQLVVLLTWTSFKVRSFRNNHMILPEDCPFVSSGIRGASGALGVLIVCMLPDVGPL